MAAVEAKARGFPAGSIKYEASIKRNMRVQRYHAYTKADATHVPAYADLYVMDSRECTKRATVSCGRAGNDDAEIRVRAALKEVGHPEMTTHDVAKRESLCNIATDQVVLRQQQRPHWCK